MPVRDLPCRSQHLTCATLYVFSCMIQDVHHAFVCTNRVTSVAGAPPSDTAEKGGEEGDTENVDGTPTSEHLLP